MRLRRVLILFVAMPLGLWLAMPMLSDGAPLSSRIDEKRQEIAKKKQRRSGR